MHADWVRLAAAGDPGWEPRTTAYLVGGAPPHPFRFFRPNGPGISPSSGSAQPSLARGTEGQVTR
jgi:hypothetical protein